MSELYRYLRVVGNDETGELADIRLPRERRELLKEYAAEVARIVDIDSLVFLAGALKDIARTKRERGASL